MLMYHANMGYPMISEKTKLTIDRAETFPVTDVHDLDRCLEFESPTPARPEEVYRHVLNEGYGVKARLENDTLAMDVIFDTAEFPYIYEWKCMACGDYVVGVEPMTTPMPEKIPNILNPGETAKHSVTWRFEEK
jgi:galactose mutarotase-like enzyme